MSIYSPQKSLFQRLFGSTIEEEDRPQVLDYGPVVIWDHSKGFNAELTLLGNAKLKVINTHPGCYGSIDITQGGAGGWSIELPEGSIVVNDGEGAVTLTSAAGAVDTLNFKHNLAQTVMKWTFLPDFT